ncbi:MAG: prepilin-type N-terminal cleavage/methylation domain-containing protein [Armatimonadetes bacterium]|nr:prepilin-type N-terminal cleavage/methylation domain-containing protein [Armatimonadota bacterium]
MNKGSLRRRLGLTLVEALVAVTLVAIGVVSALGAIAAINNGEVRIRDIEKMSQLANRKLDELVATGQITNTLGDGDFSQDYEPNYKYSVDVQPSGIENLDAVTLTVSRTDKDSNWPTSKVNTLVFTAPVTGGTTP